MENSKVEADGFVTVHPRLDDKPVVRWTKAEVDALGADKGFLPAKYWPDERSSLPDDATKRLQYPMADGLLDYFPNALAEVAYLSHCATLQHHPDQPMHWDRGKSTDHANKIMRHLVDRGKRDDKGQRHSTMVAWRALAQLQEEIERDEGLPPSRASRNRP